MQYHFTPAAERALTYACGWRSRTGCDELEAEALLLGLLAEPECRAATTLARLAIDVSAVCQRWPSLVDDESWPRGGVKPFSHEVELSLQFATERLAAFPRPLELATEHLLLGLVAANHEVSAWLRQLGLDPNVLRAEIHTLYGLQPEGVPCESPSMETLGPGLHARPQDGGATPAPESEVGPSAAAGAASSASPQQTAVLRVLDAAANRASEGLRVVEDYVRFVLDDRHLTGLCKQLRHDLTEAMSRVSPEQRLAARETQADVGTNLFTASEQSRGETATVLAANFARLQESLRSLEEFGKMFDAGLAANFKQLRYRTYTLQRSIDITRSSIERLAAARLYVLIDGGRSAEEFQRLASSLIAADADVLQLRDKRLGDRELLDRARLLRALTRGTETLFVMNDRPDLAALAGADGVHVGQEEIPVKDARSIIGPEALVGVSTHSIEQARHAVLDGANYIGVGPTFPSDTKPFSQYPGVELLRAVAAEIRLPAFAIGGICRGNLDEVLAAGFTRVAVSGAISAADDPAVAARGLLAALGSVSV